MAWGRLRLRTTTGKPNLLLSQSPNCTSFKIWYEFLLFTPLCWQAYPSSSRRLFHDAPGVPCHGLHSYVPYAVMEEPRRQSPMSSTSMKSYCVQPYSISCPLFNPIPRNSRLHNLTPAAFGSPLEDLLPYGPNSIPRRDTEPASARAFRYTRTVDGRGRDL